MDTPGAPAEWSRLVEEIVPDFVDPATRVPCRVKRKNGARNDYRVRLAREARRWEEAEGVADAMSIGSATVAARFSATPPGLDSEREKLGALAGSLIASVEQMIQREQGSAACVEVTKRH